MEKYTEKAFIIPELVGITKQTIDEHLKLYAGYVKHANLIQEKLVSLPMDETYIRTELQRRFSFEFCGMRNHELYFYSLTGSASEISLDSKLSADIVKDFGSMEAFWARFKECAMTRGIGWAVLSYDTTFDHLVISWVDEQHLGQLMSTFPVYAIDMWEHSYVADYQPSGKKNYVEDYIKNTNFSLLEKRYDIFLSNLKAI